MLRAKAALTSTLVGFGITFVVEVCQVEVHIIILRVFRKTRVTLFFTLQFLTYNKAAIRWPVVLKNTDLPRLLGLPACRHKRLGEVILLKKLMLLLTYPESEEVHRVELQVRLFSVFL